jgi:adenine/guanine phosphoribosyltransferase-like PRPP-binding protein
MGRRLETIKLQLMAVETLRFMKSRCTYSQLQEILGLPPAVLSRYVNGNVLPSIVRSRFILRKFMETSLPRIITSSLGFDGKVIDVTRLLSNVTLLKLASYVISEHATRLGGADVVLTKEADGIPLSTLVADILGARLVVAKNRKEPGARDFIEVVQRFQSGLYSHVYIPQNLIKRNNRVLIVDDIIRSGSTVEALAEAAERSRATLVAVYALVSVSGSVKTLGDKLGVPVETIVTLGPQTPS